MDAVAALQAAMAVLSQAFCRPLEIGLCQQADALLEVMVMRTLDTHQAESFPHQRLGNGAC